MRRYIARQLVQLVVVVFGISLLAFAILHVLGDPVLLLLPQNAGKEEFERYRHLLRRDTWVDSLCTAVAVAGQAAPIFWLGIMLIIVFSVRLRLLPASGYGTWQNFLMPAFCLGAALAPITMRLVRAGVIEVMNMEFIKTARAKGLAEGRVVVKHAFRNAC